MARTSVALDADSTPLVGHLAVVSLGAGQSTSSCLGAPATATAAVKAAAEPEPRSFVVRGERIRIVASVLPPAVYGGGGGAESAFLDVLRHSYFHVALLSENDKESQEEDNNGARDKAEQGEGANYEYHGCEPLHIEAIESKGGAEQCSGLARCVLGAATLPESDEAAVVLEALAFPPLLDQTRSTNQPTVRVWLEVAQYEPPAGFSIKSWSRPPLPADGLKDLKDQPSSSEESKRTRSDSSGRKVMTAAEAASRELLRMRHESVTEILGVLPSLLDTPESSPREQRSLSVGSTPRRTLSDTLKEDDFGSSLETGNLGSPLRNESTPHPVSETPSRQHSTSFSSLNVTSGAMRLIRTAAESMTGSPVHSIAATPIKENQLTIEHTAAAFAAASISDDARHPEKLRGAAPAQLPHAGGIAILRRRWRRKLELCMCPLRVRSGLHSVPGILGQVLQIDMEPGLPGEASMVVESLRLIQDQNPKGVAGPQPHVALVQVGLPKLPLTVTSGEVASMIFQPVVVRAAGPTSPRATATTTTTQQSSSGTLPPPVATSGATESVTEAEIFNLIIAVRCGRGGDRVLLRHRTAWTMPRSHDILLSVEALPTQAGSHTRTGSDVAAFSAFSSSPLPSSSPPSASINVRVQVTNISETAMSLVLVAGGGDSEASSNGKKDDYKTHVWVQSEIPFGDLAPSATRHVNCSVIPLIDGVIKLDSIRVVDRLTGTQYFPEEAPMIYNSLSVR